MSYTINYYEIRNDPDVKFWHETDEAMAWFLDFITETIESGKVISSKASLSDDLLIHTRESVFVSEEVLEEVLTSGLVSNYREQRAEYNQKNNIFSFMTDEVE